MESSFLFPDIVNVTRSWEIILKFMERASHDSVS